LEVLRLDYRTVARQRKLVAILKHDVFGDEELHAVPFYVHVTEEGPEEGFFACDEKGKPVYEDPAQQPVQNGTDETVIPRGLLRAVVQPDDPEIQNAINTLNVGIDDDNCPAPENLPNTNRGNDANVSYSNEWKHDGVCFRKSNGHVNIRDELSDELIDQYLKSKSNEGTVRSKRAVSEIIGHKLVSVPPLKNSKARHWSIQRRDTQLGNVVT